MAEIHYLQGSGHFTAEEEAAPIPPADQVRAAAAAGTATAVALGDWVASPPPEGSALPVGPVASPGLPFVIPKWVWTVGGSLAFLGLVWWLQSRHRHERLVNGDDDIERVRHQRLGPGDEDDDDDDDDYED